MKKHGRKLLRKLSRRASPFSEVDSQLRSRADKKRSVWASLSPAFSEKAKIPSANKYTGVHHPIDVVGTIRMAIGVAALTSFIIEGVNVLRATTSPKE